MAKTTFTYAICNIKYDLIIFVGRHTRTNEIVSESMASAPGYIMIGARGITADTNRTNYLPFIILKSQTATKYIHTTNQVSR